jgi:uncharacterized membrane protein YcjF (UPF0283 family)
MNPWPNYPRALSAAEVQQEAEKRKWRVKFWKAVAEIIGLFYVILPVVVFILWALIEAWKAYHWLPFAIIGAVIWIILAIRLLIIGFE